MKGSGSRRAFDAAKFIETNLHLVPVPLIPEIRLYMAHAKSGLRRLEREHDGDAPAPYWAYAWAGGTALVRYIFDHPETVRGQRILDLGSGSGLVAIAAAMAGGQVTGAEIDAFAREAIRLNCEANGVVVSLIGDNLLPGAAPSGFDLVLVGDLLYERELADRVVPFLSRCREAGIAVLIGDPGRGFLPLARLRRIADHGIPKVDEDEDSPTMPSGVFAFE